MFKWTSGALLGTTSVLLIPFEMKSNIHPKQPSLRSSFGLWFACRWWKGDEAHARHTRHSRKATSTKISVDCINNHSPSQTSVQLLVTGWSGFWRLTSSDLVWLLILSTSNPFRRFPSRHFYSLLRIQTKLPFHLSFEDQTRLFKCVCFLASESFQFCLSQEIPMLQCP